MLQSIRKKYYYMKKQHLNSEMNRKACKIKTSLQNLFNIQMNEICMIFCENHICEKNHTLS